MDWVNRMRTLVVYDSVYGNTEQIALAIGNALGLQKDIQVLRASYMTPEKLTGVELLIIGAPTQGGRPTQDMQDFLDKIIEIDLKDLKAAVFDTRFSTKMVSIFGYAAVRIAENIVKKGAKLIVSPEGFFVQGKKGPLKEGELERAASWAKAIL